MLDNLFKKAYIRYLAWICLFLSLLLASSVVQTGRAFKNMREESVLGVENYPEIKPYINSSVRAAIDLLALEEVPNLRPDKEELAAADPQNTDEPQLKAEEEAYTVPVGSFAPTEPPPSETVSDAEDKDTEPLETFAPTEPPPWDTHSERAEDKAEDEAEDEALKISEDRVDSTEDLETVDGELASNLAISEYSKNISEQLRLTELSEEYLDSLASEIKPLALEIYILPLISDHDRRGNFPSNRLNYPPPVEAKLIYTSPFLFEIDLESKADYAFANRNYLAQNVGTTLKDSDPEIVINYSPNIGHSIYYDNGPEYDFQILVYTKLSEQKGRQSAMFESAINKREKVLLAEPSQGLIIALATLFYSLAILISYFLYRQAWKSEKSHKVPLDLLFITWLLFLPLVLALIMPVMDIFSPTKLLWQIAYIGFIWTLPLFSLVLIIYLLLIQCRNRCLRENLLISLIIKKIKSAYRTLYTAVKSWPVEVRRHNRLSFLLVFLILILIALAPARLALVLLIPLIYIAIHFFVEMSYLIRSAEQPVLASELEAATEEDQPLKKRKFRLFTLLKPLEEALARNHRASAENLQAKLKSERMRSELITNVSHDIKTPLTSIMSYGNLLRSELESENYNKELGLDYLETILKQCKRLQRLSNDLIESSKLHSGAVQLKPGVLNLNELLNQALAEYIELFKEKKLELICDLEEEVYVIADGDALWRVLANLLSNIAQYSRAETRIYITLQVDQLAKIAKLWLRNLSKEALNMPSEDLLERFVQGDTARNSEGSGLGLSIASTLMSLMQGELKLQVIADLFTAELNILLAPSEIGSAEAVEDQAEPESGDAEKRGLSPEIRPLDLNLSKADDATEREIESD